MFAITIIFSLYFACGSPWLLHYTDWQRESQKAGPHWSKVLEDLIV
jgi:hypothetical protein